MLALAGCLGFGAPSATWAEVAEIVVTTRQRAENLQEVPIAIAAITGEDVERRGIDNLAAVTRQTPSLALDKGFSPQDTRIVIRGLAPTRGRQNAAVLVDGIDISSESIQTAGGSLLIDPALFDIERVEVVKGPQNALYGRSAFNGAISYITRQPSESFEGRVGTDVGSDGRLRLSGGVSGPLGGDFYGGLSGLIHDFDGYYTNSVTGEEIGGSDGSAFAGTLRWVPTERLAITARVQYSDDDYEVDAYGFADPNQQFPIPAGALAANGGFIPAGFPPALDVGTLIGTPGIPPLVPGFVPGPGGTFPDESSLPATLSEDPRTGSDYSGASREVARATLNIEWDLGEVKLTSLSHAAATETFQNHDGNSIGSVSVLPFHSEVWFDNDTDLLSQELRLQSNDDSSLQWTIGALYWDEETDFRDGSLNCFTNALPFSPNDTGFPPFIPPLPLTPCGPFVAGIVDNPTQPGQFARNPDRWFRDTEHWSAYFLVDWQFLDNWSLAIEGRYVDEDLDVGGPDLDTVIDPFGLGYNQDPAVLAACVPFPFVPNSCIAPVLAGVNTGSESDSFFTPKATVRWTPFAEQMYYFSVARAEKPSGISTVTGGIGAFVPEDNKFRPEKLTVWELGSKTRWLENRLQLNGAVFYQDFEDKQVSTQVPAGSLLKSKVINVPAEVWGAELQLDWFISDYLSFTGAYTWLDTEYESTSEIFSRSTGTVTYSGSCNQVVGTGSQARCLLDYSGNELEYAPDHAFTGTLSYRRPLRGATDWLAEFDGSYTDERYADQANTVKFDSYWLANLRLGVSSDRWDVIGYVDNLFDDDTIKTGFTSIDPRYIAFDPATFFGPVLPNGARLLLPDQRSYGLRVNYRFGG
jgi:outer membrane receptor protein involved in Fe transport